MEQFELNAENRELTGKGHMRRMRIAGNIPAVLYGAGKDPVNLSIEEKPMMLQLENEAFYSHILTLNIGGKAERVILRDLQRHPFRQQLLHADFLRVDENRKLHMNVPLHFINEDTCIGVKQDGGAVSHMISELEITCLPKDLPEFIEVDMVDVKMDETLHLTDLKLPAGVEIPALIHGADADQPVVAVHEMRVAVIDEPVEGEVGEEGDEAAAAGDDAAADTGNED